MNCLVFGGTRYFGRHLVNNLLKAGHDVTVVNRGNLPNAFDKPVRHIKAARQNELEVRDIFAKTSYDVVYDQIGYTKSDADLLASAMKGKCGRFVFTSTQSVYFTGANLSEASFDPKAIDLSKPVESTNPYQEGKREAEAVYAQRVDCPTVMMRIPIVLGMDDYTRRLHFHIERILKNQPIFFPNIGAKISFVHVKDVGSFLAWLATSDKTGTVNACSPTHISLRDLVHKIEHVADKKANLVSSLVEDETHSPFGIQNDATMNTDLVNSWGFKLGPVEEWLPSLISEMTGAIKLTL
jgi:nucleoside-diphosphate-sugar epimerase